MIINTVEKLYVDEYSIQNSKFIAYLYPFTQKEQLKEYLAVLQSQHPKANHICYAYRIGYENEEFRANDDGEPSGTAGKPILNQLYSSELKNCVLFVVRYFGGTKLGASGLISAYKTSAQNCIIKAGIIQKEQTKLIEFTVFISEYYKLIEELKKNKVYILSQEFVGNQCEMKVDIEVSKMSLIENYIE